MNKREFVMGSCAALAGGAAASAAAEKPPQAATGVAQGLRRQRLPDLATDVRAQAWRAYLGQRFDAVVAGAMVPLTLQEVSMHAVDAGKLEQFTLVFSAQAMATLPAGTHVLSHRTGQRVAVYLDPTQSHASSTQTCRADFSLLV